MFNKILAWIGIYGVFWYFSAMASNFVYNTFQTEYLDDIVRTFMPFLLLAVTFLVKKSMNIDFDFIKKNRFLQENKLLFISFALIEVFLIVVPLLAFLIAGLIGFDDGILYFVAFLLHLFVCMLPYTLNLLGEKKKPTKTQFILMVGMFLVSSAQYFIFITA